MILITYGLRNKVSKMSFSCPSLRKLFTKQMDRHDVNSACVQTHTHSLSLSLSLAQMESSVLVILQILSSPQALFRPAVCLKPTSLAALSILSSVCAIAPAVMERQEDNGASFLCSLDSSSLGSQFCLYRTRNENSFSVASS